MNSVHALLWVTLGGSLGVVWRLLFLRLCQAYTQLKSFLALLFVNALGCLFAGLLLGLWAHHSEVLNSAMFAFAVVGFLGSYTSVSAFALETFFLFQQRLWGQAIGYMFASLALCFAAFALGWMISSGDWSRL